MRKKKNGFPEEMTFWQSYSDMMAALLLVFVLIIAFTIIKAKADYEERQEALEIQRQEVEEYKNKLEQSENEYQEQQILLKKQEKELKEQQNLVLKQQESIAEQTKKTAEQQQLLAEQQKTMDEQQLIMDEQKEKLDKIVGVKSNIISELKEAFKDSGMRLTVDSETGSISFDSGVLFDFGKYELKPEGKAFLNKFFPKYFEVILGETTKTYISEVIIEGHTDDSGGYLLNLDLSQKRAYAVAEYCLSGNNRMFSESRLETVRALVTANGRAYYELKYDAKGNVDAAASRRVEVKFRLTDDEMIKEMSEILE